MLAFLFIFIRLALAQLENAVMLPYLYALYMGHWLHGFMTGPFLLSISVFIFSFFISLFYLVPCGRLSWLYASVWAHVNILHRLSLRSATMLISFSEAKQNSALFSSIEHENYTKNLLCGRPLYSCSDSVRPLCFTCVYLIFTARYTLVQSAVLPQ